MPDATVRHIDVDTEDAEASLKQLEMHSDMTAKSVMQTVSKSYSSLILMADIMGIIIPEWFSMMSTAAIMAAQTMVELAAADTVSGIMAWRAGATFAMASLMFARAMVIQQEGDIVERKLNSFISVLGLWS